LQLIERQADEESGRARFGFHAPMAAMLAHDAHGIAESPTKPTGGRIRCRERIEDALLQLGALVVPRPRARDELDRVLSARVE